MPQIDLNTFRHYGLWILGAHVVAFVLFLIVRSMLRARRRKQERTAKFRRIMQSESEPAQIVE